MNKEKLLELSDTLRGIADGKEWEIHQWNWPDDRWEDCWTDNPLAAITEGCYIRLKPQPPPLDPYAELKAAHAAGKKLQHRYSGMASWEDCSVSDTKQDPYCFIHGRECYRIKPEPRKVPLGPDDVPPGSVFRSKELPDGWIAPTSVSAGAGCYFHDEVVFRYKWAELQEKQEIKRPGEDWQPCWKETEQ